MKTIKVQLLTNRIQEDINPILAYAHAYNLKNGITLNFDIQAVDVHGYVSTYTEVRPGVFLWILNGSEILVPLSTTHDINIFIFNQNEWLTPAGSQYPLLPNTPTSDTILVNNKPFINYGLYAGDPEGSVMFVHELMHAYTKIANASGFPTVDQMDTYLDNANPDSPIGNFSIQWKNLNPWLINNSDTIMNVNIKRNSDNGTETLGTLTLTRSDGSIWSCSTLERPWLNNQHNVSCIPLGTYQCSIQHFYQTNMYELANVPNRTGIFIHPANYFNQLEGCIALGVSPSDINSDGQIDVTNSVVTISQFMNELSKQPFTLVIE